MKNNRRKTGAILITTALLSTFILGLTAIVVDVGYLYSKNNELQTAVNAGWLAGYDRMMHLKGSSSTLTNEAKENIKSHILEVMVHNGFENNQESSLKVEVTDNRLLKVSARSHVGLFFARIIEADSNPKREVKTSILNDVIRDAFIETPPASFKGKRLKVYFTHQSGTKPPRFDIEVNSKGLVHFSYYRYLENKIRENIDFSGTPIIIQFKNKGEQEL